MTGLFDNVGSVQPWTRCRSLCEEYIARVNREPHASRNAAAELKEPEARLYECIK